MPVLPHPAWALLPLLLWPLARWRLLVLLLVAALAFCIWRAGLRIDQQLAPQWVGEVVTLRGEIRSVPEYTGDASRFLFAPEGAQWPRRLRVSWYRDAPALQAGACWQLRLKLRAPRGSRNFSGLDYEGWLYRQGIGGLATARGGRPCSDGVGQGLQAWRQRWSQRIAAPLAQHPAGGVVLGLTVGLRSGIDDGQWALFRRTGTSHLMAISGLHLGLAAGWLLLLVGGIWRRIPRACLHLPAAQAGGVAAAAGAVLYALASGWGLPAQRAAVMAVVLALALLRRRPLPAVDALALAALAVLLLDPAAVIAPGFWLSFAAVACIILLLRPGRGIVGNWWRVQWLLALALLPLTLVFFDAAPWIAPLANLVLVPLFGLLLPVLLVGALLAGTVPGDALLVLGADALQVMLRGLSLLAQAPPLNPAAPPAAVTALALAGAVMLLLPAALRLRMVGVVCLLPLLLARPPPLAEGEFDLSVLDVGQGLAVVLRSREQLLVYDSGPAWSGGFDAGAQIVTPALRALGADRIDELVVSHGDLDHRGGAAALSRAFVIGRRRGAGGEPCRQGQSWRRDGLHFRVLHPARPAAVPGNNDSCVLHIAGPNGSVLLPGDLEAVAERALLRNGTAPAADILLAPHHGSASSSSPGFVRAVAPRIVVYAAGHANRWGFPRPEVDARYAALGARRLSTADGAVQIRVRAGQAPAVERWADRRRRFWHVRG